MPDPLCQHTGRKERSLISSALLCAALFLFPLLSSGCETPIVAAPTSTPAALEYHNSEYGFTFTLPSSWQGYSVIASNWTGTVSDPVKGDVPSTQGPLLSIRHPLWTEQSPRQDIPIMVFTHAQWQAVQRGAFLVSAAPVLPRELGSNASYVFALPARYNYAFPTGWQEVDAILATQPLHTP